MEIDNAGAIIDNIKSDVIYITPSSQFPLGIKMSMERKLEISSWAKDKYIIEDSFDSEFKYLSNQSISLFELNNNTILLSSYSRSISPALRIAYMILPDKLLNRYDEKYGFYSTTVSTLDQMILNEFIASGAYSRHINKVKNSYIEKKELIKNILEKENIKIAYDGYLSMIIDIDDLNKEKFIKKCMEYKIDISLLDDYYLNKKTNKIIIGYSGININLIGEAISLLTKAIKESKVA
jgi:GntR family transcriptional regulator/MocR family aminotransferase